MKLCITGGGTGGHLVIAQALLEASIKKGYEVIFIGSTHGQDRKYFEHERAFSHVYFLPTTGVVNQKGLAKLKALYKIFRAFLTSRYLLKMHRIDAVYSVGGFSAAPASFASLIKKIPLFIHEQNAVEGRLNSLLKPYAKSFVSAYDKDSTIKGYPVKEVFSNTARLRKNLNTIIFLGGSHGAKAINNLALSVCGELSKRGIKIIHQAGESDFDRVKSAYEKIEIEVELYAFTQDLASMIEESDLAVSRAGASTLWELTTNGCPAFYVPYPYAAGDHQYQNAKFIVDNNLGWCEREDENLKDKFLEILDASLEEKSGALMQYASKDVALQMINKLEEFLND
ncbi:MAG: undecaprenyldiphospho-muramoylpentapeptide beta-N-acetylglucosaminyltransferase [Sulfurimonas sp.]|nr:undecaprenyldiphospho-muramoylpentapeptide beta-N-acetylglucosaminyltransferase [Sulfurimonas sp.]